MSDARDDDKTVVLGGASAAPATPQLQEHAHNALPVGARLGEFEIIGLVGEGGFGIVYLAQDHSLERKVALKEYMPASLAARTASATVSVRSERHRETFEIGRRSFVNEARLLAQFDHPALVKVYRFWEANGTAYMAMPYYDGRTLRDVLKARGDVPDESWIRKILAPVIDALELIHRENCFHRDVAPDNIMLLRDDRPVLLDFGAARRVIGDMTQALTVILKPGYAPIEQYAEMPGMQQGPWTDVYALGAVIYFMITGKTPPPSVGRMMQDSYQPLATLAAGRYGDNFLRGVDRSLAVRSEDRPQTMAEMREALGWGLDSPLFAAPGAAVAPATTARPPQAGAAAAPAGTGGSRNLIIGAAALAVVAAAGAGYWFLAGGKPAATPAAEVAPVPPTPPVAVQPPPVTAPVVPQAPASPRPAAATLAATYEAILAGADPAMTPRMEAPATVIVGQDQLKLQLDSKIAGHLYLFLWDSGDDMVYRLFPNDADADSTLGVGNTFHVPRPHLRMPWVFPAQAPAGEWRVLAVVSEQVRDFDRAAIRRDGDLLSASREGFEAALAGGADIGALIGTPRCVAGEPCSGRYGARVAAIRELPPPAAKPAPTPAARPDAIAKPATRPPAQAGDGGAGSAPAPQRAPAAKPKEGDTQKAEREYMQQLNKDLDRLLQN